MHSIGHCKDKYFPAGLMVQRKRVAKLLGRAVPEPMSVQFEEFQR